MNNRGPMLAPPGRPGGGGMGGFGGMFGSSSRTSFAGAMLGKRS